MAQNNSTQYKLTVEGVKELEQELDELKGRQHEVADRLKSAKEQLDLTENSDWADAQDEFKFVQSRIDEIEHILRSVKIIKNPRNSTKIQLGSQVELSLQGKKINYTLVGSLEANPEEKKISEESPLGKALMGKTIGEKVDINTPSGKHTYIISGIN